ncbi:MAG: hypothetical protein V2A73_18735, partial [Pseudomonadota bacterium]
MGANIGGFISIALSGLTPLSLAVGDNYDSNLTITVSTNATYNIQVNCDFDANKGGKDINLFQSLAGAYVVGGKYLANVL